MGVAKPSRLSVARCLAIARNSGQKKSRPGRNGRDGRKSALSRRPFAAAMISEHHSDAPSNETQASPPGLNENDLSARVRPEFYAEPPSACLRERQAQPVRANPAV